MEGVSEEGEGITRGGFGIWEIEGRAGKGGVDGSCEERRGRK